MAKTPETRLDATQDDRSAGLAEAADEVAVGNDRPIRAAAIFSTWCEIIGIYSVKLSDEKRLFRVDSFIISQNSCC